MTHNDNGSRQPCQEPEARPVTDTPIIRETTDSVETAVRVALATAYEGEDLWGYDRLLTRAGASVDRTLTAWRSASDDAARAAATEAVGQAVTALRRTHSPGAGDVVVSIDIPTGWDPAGELRARDVLGNALRELGADDLEHGIASAAVSDRRALHRALDDLVQRAVSEVAGLGWPLEAEQRRGLPPEHLAECLVQERVPTVHVFARAAVSACTTGTSVQRLAAAAERMQDSANWTVRSPEPCADCVITDVLMGVYETALREGVRLAEAAQVDSLVIVTERMESDRDWEPDEVAALAARTAIGVALEAGVAIPRSSLLDGCSLMDLAALQYERRRARVDEHDAVHLGADAAAVRRRQQVEERERARAAARRNGPKTPADEARAARAAAKRARRAEIRRQRGGR